MTSMQRPLYLVLLTVSSCVLPEYTKDFGSIAAAGASAGSAALGGTSTRWTGSSNSGGTLAPAGGRDARGGTASLVSGNGAAGGSSTNGGVSTSPWSSLGGGAPLGGLAGADTRGGAGGNATVATTYALGGSSGDTGAAGSSGAPETGGTAGSGGTGTGGWTSVQCPEGYAACRSPTCDTQTSRDTNNCGQCGNVCAGKQVARWTCDSACIVADDVNDCSPGFRNCNGLDSDGCEVELAVPDPSNCGACNVRCTNLTCGNNRCDSICGKRATDATASCFQATLVGSDTDLGLTESFGTKWLIGVRQTLGDYPDPTLVAMGVVEKEGISTPVKYTLGLYDSDPLGEPRNLLWQSPLQTAAGAPTAPRTNIVQLASPISLVADEHYWQMVLVYDPMSPNSNAALLIATADESSAGQERIYGYGHGTAPENDPGTGITSMPNSLSGTAYQDLSRGDFPRKAPAIFSYVAHP